MTYADHICDARASLEAARRLLQAEISAYPAPISGCDAQFNRLLADRQQIRDALAALEALPFVPTPRQPFPDAQVESR